MNACSTFAVRTLVAAISACFTGSAYSAPQAPTVVAGQAAFQQAGKTLTVTNAPGTIINWQSFSINRDEVVRFLQQSSTSQVLNRVTGIDPSVILGQLQSNGRVLLINPNGVLFGKGAQVDVAGLLVSTLQLKDADFLSGRYKFNDTPGAGSVSNQGTIRTQSGGHVVLIAPKVENSGIIQSPEGQILLAAGRSVTLADPDKPAIQVEITNRDNTAVNLGTLIAKNVTLYGGIIKNSGLIQATTAVVGENGKIRLQAKYDVENTGTLQANGAQGGDILLQAQEGVARVQGVVEAKGSLPTVNPENAPKSEQLGKGGRIEVLAPDIVVDGVIDTSGTTGGGAILIGGQYQGGNAPVPTDWSVNPALQRASLSLENPYAASPNLTETPALGTNPTDPAQQTSNASQNSPLIPNRPLPTARTTTISTHSRIRADAIEEGDGGIIVVWSDDHTTVQGALSARGGAKNGNGGLIETSGHHVKLNAIRIDASAPAGQTGKWLIDPVDFTIAATGGDITGAQLSANLGSADVEILSSAGAQVGAGDINVNDAVTWTSHRLTLTAAHDININAVMTASGTSSLVMNTGTANGGNAGVAGGMVRVGFDANGNFAGRVDFGGRSGTGLLTINGNNYTVINALGTQGDTSANTLQGMSGNLTGYYALGADIDASTTAGWNSGQGFAPIAQSGGTFLGAFNGLGHTISNLTMNRPGQNNLGLFGYVGKVSLSNVGLVNAHIVGDGSSWAVGALVGQMEGTWIDNAYSSGVVSGRGDVGGLAGYSAWWTESGLRYEPTIRNSHSLATVTGTGWNVGGLLGSLEGGNGGLVLNSYATGNVSGYGYVGGLVGQSWSSDNNLIANSYATGNVSGTWGVGGLIGEIDRGYVRTSFATGMVSGNLSAGKSTGGLVGENYGAISDSYALGAVQGGENVGGLIGYNSYQASVQNSFSVGKVTNFTGNNNAIGGLIGWQNTSYALTGTIANNYWNIDTSGVARSYGATGLTSAQMKQQASFAGFNFATTWSVDEGLDIPELKIFAGPTNTWTGGAGNTVWAAAANWSLGHTPLANEKVYIPDVASSSFVEIASGSVALRRLISDELFKVSNSGTALTVTGSSTINAGMVLDAGASFTAIGSFTLGAGSVFSANGALNLNARNLLAGARIDLGASASLTMYGQAYTIIRTLGIENDTSGATLQGINGNLAGNYVLANDIDASATSGWNASAGFVPLGNGTTRFSGNFDGLGHAISNLRINRPTTDYVGLFGYAKGASLANLSILNANIVGQNYVGALAGQMIDGSASNVASSGSITGNFNTGGLIGWADAYYTGTLAITNASSAAAVVGQRQVGGLIGQLITNNGAILVDNSHSTGSVTGHLSVGGLVGAMSVTDALSPSIVSNSSHTVGTVSGMYDVGGLIGRREGYRDANNVWQAGGVVVDSFNTGDVLAMENDSTGIGGLIGSSFGGSVTRSYSNANIVAANGATDVGGLIGYNAYTNKLVQDSYASGSVTVGNNAAWVGGLFGENGAPVIGSYATNTINAGDYASYVGGLMGEHYGNGLQQSYATGNVTVGSNASSIGGLLGESYSHSPISNSYASGAVSAGGNSYDIGGFVGTNYDAITASHATGNVSAGAMSDGVAGFMGSSSGAISNSYATGSVSAGASSMNVAGFAGWHSGTGSISNSYSTGAISAVDGASPFVANKAATATITNSYYALDGTTVNGQIIVGDYSKGQGVSQVQLNDWVSDGHVLRAIGSYLTQDAEGFYQIGSSADFLKLLPYIETSGYKYRLTQNIDLAAMPGYFLPVFGGNEFDGAGKVISNLSVMRTDIPYVGLFGRNTAAGTIHDLGVVNATLSGQTVGAVVALNQGIVSNVYATGSVAGSSEAGGLVGWNQGSIANSYALVNVTLANYYPGGGLVGYNEGTIATSYSAGAVSGPVDATEIGGLVGLNDYTVTASYWDINTSGQSTSSGGVGLTTSQMKQQASFAGFDFGTVWSISEGNAYPTLKPPVVILTNTWLGGYGNLWATAANWSLGHAPSAGEKVVIPDLSNTDYVEFSSIALPITSLTTSEFFRMVGAGTSLSVSQNAIFNASLSLDANSTLTVNGALTLATAAAIQKGGKINLGPLASLSIAGNAYTLIRDIDELQAAAYEARYALATDIDASVTSTWNSGAGFSPLGRRFDFDGLGHSVTNLFINRPSESSVGLFSYNNAQISNVHLVNSNVSGGDFVGGLVGANNGAVANSSFDGSVVGSQVVGGLVGTNQSGAVVNASSSSGSVSGQYDVGGLAGSNSGAISQSFSMAAVTGTWSRVVGGLVGYNASNGLIIQSYSSGAVAGDSNIGGLVGFNDGTISESYSTGAVTGSGWGIGGLVGYNRSQIADSYALAPSVQGGGYLVGGLVGLSEGTVSNAYYNIDTTLINGAKVVTRYGIYGGQFQDWLNNGRSLDIANYLTSDVDGYYQIGSLQNLKDWLAFAELPGSKYRLTANLDLAGLSGWNLPYFSGAEIDGAGHTLSHLSVNQPYNDQVGLVGTLEAGSSLHDIGVVDASVRGSWAVGGLVGYNMGDVARSYVTGAATTIRGDSDVRGLVGSNDGTISNSHYNIEAVQINGAQGVVTEGGIYGSQFADWLANGLSLNAANYLATDASGYYQIGSVQNLKDMLGFVDQAGSKFRLTADIDLGAIPGWHIPVFRGAEIDGVGHVLSNLSINQPFNWGEVGLIGNLVAGAEIRNIGVENVSLSGYGGVGGVVGWNQGIVRNTYSTGTINGGVYSSNLGGLVGSNSGSIEDSFSTVNIVAGGSDYVGGLVGVNGGSISNSYATGTVTGVYSVGGLVGYNYGTISGGIWNQESSGTAVGIGNNQNGAVATGLTSAQMIQASNFSGWDFAGTWDIAEGVSAPRQLVFSGALNQWLGSVDALWFNAANWSLGHTPLSNERVGIYGSSPLTITYSGTGSVRSLVSDWSFSMSGSGTSLTVSNNAIFNGGLSLDANSTLTVNGALQLANNPVIAKGGKVDLGLSASLSIGGYAYTLLRDINALQDIDSITHYALATDIDALATASWNSGQGFVPTTFGATFEGLGHTVSNLTINRPGQDVIGLFGWNYGEIHNLHLANVNVIGNSQVGGLVGQNQGTISQSSSSGTVVGDSHVGGLVGNNVNGGTISQSSNSGAVTGSYYVGGLVGINFNGGTVSQSSNSGAVTGSYDVGGLVGYNFNGGTVSQSASVGGVNGVNRVGGLVGYNYIAAISQSSSSGAVSGNYGVGGLVGENESGTISESSSTGAVTGIGAVGGLVGSNFVGSTISWSFSTGSVSGLDMVGGLVGYHSGQITDSYALAPSVQGTGYVGGLVGRTEGMVGNAYYDVDTTRINGAFAVTRYGIYSSQFQDWRNNGLALDIAAYLTADSNGYYQIGSQQNLKDWLAFAEQPGAKFRLTADLDLSSLSGWNLPVFSGAEIDGGGHVLSHLNVNQPYNERIGFVGTLVANANLHDIQLVDANVQGSVVGSLVGWNEGGVSNSQVTGMVAGYYSAGGLVGENYGTITRSSSVGTVTASDSYAGGLVGRNYGQVTDSFSQATSVHGASDVGGLFGTNWGTSSNAHYNIDQTQINGVAGVVTEGGLYGSQFADWLAGGLSLNAANYLITDANGYYQLGSVQNLKDMLGFVDAAGSKFRLTSDIDLTTIPGWFIPVFRGAEIDGAGHVLSNLSVNQPYNNMLGLIGHLPVGGVIRNVGLEGANIVGGAWGSGALVGWNEGSIETAYSMGYVTGNGGLGGLVGINDGSILNSFSTVTVDGAAQSAGNVGGLVGENNASITNSYASGVVSGSATGGLIGYNNGTVTAGVWNTETSGQSVGIGTDNAGAVVTAMTSAQMADSANFAGWNFSGVWSVVGGVPRLQGVGQSQTNIWTGLFDNHDWFAAGNWSLGHAPTASENVSIPDLIGTTQIDINSGSSFSVRTLSSGEFLALGGSGTSFLLSNGGVLSAGLHIGSGAMLTSAGNLIVGGGASQIDVGASLVANAGLTIGPQATLSMSGQLRANTFATLGTLSLQRGAQLNVDSAWSHTGALNVGGAVGLSGPLDIDDGRVNLASGASLSSRNSLIHWNGGTIAGTGTVDLQGEAMLVIDGQGRGDRVLSGPDLRVDTFDLLAGSVEVQQGTLRLPLGGRIATGTQLSASGGSLEIGGALSIAGDLITQGTSTVSANAPINVLAGGLLQAGGSAAQFADALVVDGTLEVLSGTTSLNGGGTYTHSGTFRSGSAGTLNFAAGIHRFADGSQFDLNGRLINAAQLVLLGQHSGVTVARGSSLDLNQANFSGSGVLRNQGLVVADGSSFTGYLVNEGNASLRNGVVLTNGFYNTGNLNITAGIVVAQGARSELAGGVMTLSPGATLEKSSGILAWSGGAFGGSGTLGFSNGGLIAFAGEGERVLNNANLSFRFTNLSLPSGSLRLEAGRLQFDTTVGSATQIPLNTALTVYGGELMNNGPLNVSGLFGLYGGQLTGAGAINMTGGTIDLPASSTVNWQSTGQMSNSGTLNMSNRTITNPITNNGTINSAGGLIFTGQFTNAGSLSLSGGTTTFSGGYVQNGGALRLGAGAGTSANVVVGGSGFSMVGGTLSGSGTISGDLSLTGGLLSVGFSPGSLTVNGNLNLSPTSVTQIELGGTTPGSGFDTITVTGTANLAGTLNVSSYGGYVPAAGSSYTFMNFASSTGAFSSTNLPAGWNMSMNTSTASLNLLMAGAASAASSSMTSPLQALVQLQTSIGGGTTDPGALTVGAMSFDMTRVTHSDVDASLIQQLVMLGAAQMPSTREDMKVCR